MFGANGVDSMKDFFEQLTQFSRRVFFQGLGLPTIGQESPWSGPALPLDNITGTVIHYTTGNNLRDTVRWFLYKPYDARVSAHFVVADNWPEGMREYAKGLPLIEALPTMAVLWIIVMI